MTLKADGTEKLDRVVDFRSDTVTKPTDRMREAMLTVGICTLFKLLSSLIWLDDNWRIANLLLLSLHHYYPYRFL